jgi:hypothetical protein
MMTHTKPLSEFLTAISKDPRIGPVHVALFTVLFNRWVHEQFPEAIRIMSYEVMPLAKIASKVTFYKTIKELNAYGYLRYVPYLNRKGSEVYFKTES